MENKKTEVIGKKKIWSLSYADDIALIATSEQELKRMMKKFKKYREERTNNKFG